MIQMLLTTIVFVNSDEVLIQFLHQSVNNSTTAIAIMINNKNSSINIALYCLFEFFCCIPKVFLLFILKQK